MYLLISIAHNIMIIMDFGKWKENRTNKGWLGEREVKSIKLLHLNSGFKIGINPVRRTI